MAYIYIPASSKPEPVVTSKDTVIDKLIRQVEPLDDHPVSWNAYKKDINGALGIVYSEYASFKQTANTLPLDSKALEEHLKCLTKALFCLWAYLCEGEKE